MNEIQNSTRTTTTNNILRENDNEINDYSTAAEETDQVEVIPCITDNDNEESESCWTPPHSESKFSKKKIREIELVLYFTSFFCLL